MFVTVIRVAVVYVIVSISVRLMGKRQLGDLHPAEFVITMLLSEIAATSIADTGTSMLRSLIALLMLVSFEVISSFIALKSEKYKKAVEGSPLIVVKDGCVDRIQLEKMRMTSDDLYEALRQKDVFDITEVKYAIVETSGMLSVMLKEEKK